MKLFTIISSAFLAGCAFADAMPPVPMSGVSPEQRQRKRKKVTQEAQMRSFGGFVTADYTGRYCYFMNAQKRVDIALLEEVAGQIRQVLSLPTRVESCAIPDKDNFFPLRTVWSGNRPTGAVVSVIDLIGWGSILVAPEDGWAQVNVAALAKDNPSQDVLEKRLRKEIWRAFVILLGGGNARLAGDLMRPIASLKDLDASPNLVPGPEAFNAVIDSARARGITQIRRSTYKQACEEGWAPAPTNDAQRAIWEKVHALPTEPLKIKPETAKQK